MLELERSAIGDASWLSWKILIIIVCGIGDVRKIKESYINRNLERKCGYVIGKSNR